MYGKLTGLLLACMVMLGCTLKADVLVDSTISDAASISSSTTVYSNQYITVSNSYTTNTFIGGTNNYYTTNIYVAVTNTYITNDYTTNTFIAITNNYTTNTYVVNTNDYWFTNSAGMVYTNGNVGVNTTNPTAMLDVSGTARITGATTAAQFLVSTTNLWEDITVPAQSLNPAGTPDAASLITTWGPGGNLLAAEFEDNKVDCTFANVQMPHSWLNPGGDISAHLHVSPNTTTTGTVVFALIWTDAGIGNKYTRTYTNVMTNVVVTGSQWTHLMWNWPRLSATNSTTISSMINFRIERWANTDAADNYGAALHILDFDVHYRHRGTPVLFDPIP